MTSGITDTTLGEPKNLQRRKHPNLQIFIICLFISIIMWMMIRLSREYSQVVRVSAIYTGLQADNIMLPASDTVFFVTLQSTGYNILFRSLSHQKYRVEIDLSQYPTKLQGNNFDINVDVNGIHDLVAANFKVKDKIVSYLPDNLKIRLDKAFIKKVPVVLDAEMTFEKQYTLYHKVFFDPDSVLVTGPQDILQTIDFVKTEKRNFNNLSSNTSVTLKLVNNNNPSNVRYSHEYVKVFIPVVQSTEDYLEVGVSADSLPPDLHLTTNPEKIKVFYSVCLPDIKKVKENEFHLSISSSNLVQTGSKAKVMVTKSPSFVKILRLEPEIIDFSIRK